MLQVLTQEKYVISLGNSGVRLNNRRGILKHNYASPAMKSLSCMSFTKDTHEILVGGSEKKLLKINLDTQIITPVKCKGTVTKLTRASQAIAGCKTDGTIDIFDLNSNQIVKTFNSPGGIISDMDAKESILMTCGYSQKKVGFVLDPLINVYDLRAGKSLPPIPFPAGAGFVRLHPKLSTCVIIASQNGQIQILDYANPANVYLHQADLSGQLVGMEVSPSGDFMALLDGSFIQLWNNVNTGSSFLEFANPTEYPAIDLGGPELSLDDPDSSFSSVGLPYYKEELLSSWSDPSFVYNVGMPSNTNFSQDSVTDMKPTGFGGFMGFNKAKLKNTAQKYVSYDKKNGSTVPMFISEKLRSGQVEDLTSLFADDDKNSKNAPKIYWKHDIQYSRFGINDFDFAAYNNTKYSGLEHHSPNAYCNPLLQVYRYSDSFFRFALNYLTHNKLDEKSLLSELGLLFDMLDKAQGQHCQALNFLKTLSQIPQANALGLILDDHKSTTNNKRSLLSEGLLLQSFCRFLMEQIASEGGVRFESIAGCPTTIETKVPSCGTTSSRHSIFYNIELYAPKLFLIQSKPTFLQALQDSFVRTTQTRGWCDKCKKYQTVHSTKIIEKLPITLNIHIPLGKSSQEDAITEIIGLRQPEGEVLMDERFYRNTNWPALSFGLNKGMKVVDAKNVHENGDIYELMGIVIEVGQPESHLVSYVRIDEKTRGSKVKAKNWYLFNDFLVKQVSESEVLNFTHRWKSPVMLVYQKKLDLPPFDVEDWRSRLDTSILYRDHFAAGVRENIQREYTLLTKEEAPKPGTLVAMDAEFVMLQQEETEIISDGTRSLLRPRVLSLARVSVVRGEGALQGIPFIDDFIMMREDTIVDYLTQFSGIEPGDLDPMTSRRSLVTRQTSYKKLWLLLNLGCIFIGHGLANDFRTINIQVPAAQVIDTLDIYFIKSRQRRLSLKFLAWLLLDQNVQTGNHDSIEDARTALFLYNKYQELVREGKFEQTLAHIYSEGKKYNFKPPPVVIPAAVPVPPAAAAPAV